MEIHKAKLIREGDKVFLKFLILEKEYQISLTENKPLDVKEVFNNLIILLKKGIFNFEFEDDKTDLYHEISKEYITQLNLELSNVYQELKDYDLLEIKFEEPEESVVKEA